MKDFTTTRPYNIKHSQYTILKDIISLLTLCLFARLGKSLFLLQPIYGLCIISWIKLKSFIWSISWVYFKVLIYWIMTSRSKPPPICCDRMTAVILTPFHTTFLSYHEQFDHNISSTHKSVVFNPCTPNYSLAFVFCLQLPYTRATWHCSVQQHWSRVMEH